MKRHQIDGVAYCTFESLAPYGGELVHAVTTRHGGVSTGSYRSLNVSHGLGDDPVAVEENLRRACRALGLCREDLVSPNQRHTANVRRVGRADCGQVVGSCDGLLTDAYRVPVLLRYADCAPVLIYDPVHRALALVHSGWRGTVQGVVRAALAAMVREFGSRPSDLVAAVGPSIGPCCYEVGGEVVDAVRAVFDRSDSLLPVDGGGRRRFDLWAANRRWLVDGGVRQIEVGGVCTACRTDEFYSHRAEAGKTGHFAAMMMLQGRPL